MSNLDIWLVYTQKYHLIYHGKENCLNNNLKTVLTQVDIPTMIKHKLI